VAPLTHNNPGVNAAPTAVAVQLAGGAPCRHDRRPSKSNSVNQRPLFGRVIAVAWRVNDRPPATCDVVLYDHSPEVATSYSLRALTYRPLLRTPTIRRLKNRYLISDRRRLGRAWSQTGTRLWTHFADCESDDEGRSSVESWEEALDATLSCKKSEVIEH